MSGLATAIRVNRVNGRGAQRKAGASLNELVYLTLSDTKQSSRRAHRVNQRLGRLQRGEEVEPPAPLSPRRLRAKKRAMARQVQKNLGLGSYTRASRSLEGNELADVSCSDTMEKLKDLHPAADPPTFGEPPNTPHIPITAAVLKKRLKRLPKGSAAGPSGWTYEHLQAVAYGTSAGFEALLELINAILEGELEDTPELLACRLIPLVKPGGGIRPIAIGEVWVRLAALCALDACGVPGTSFLPLQLGVGVPGGAQCMSHAITAYLRKHVHHVAVQLDWKNAFNSLDRTAMVKAVAERAPSLSRFVRWAYARPSPLLVGYEPGEQRVLFSQTGTRQGDPLSPFCFAATLQGVLEKLQRLHPQVTIIAYADDTFLLGDADAVAEAARDLQELGLEIHLQARPDKCKVYSPTVDRARAVHRALGFQLCEEGLVVTGSPIGCADFIKSHVQKVADKVVHSIDTLMDLDVRTQDQLLLLRKSLQLRFAHMTRGAKWEHIREALEMVQSEVLDATAELVGSEGSVAEHFRAETRQQMCLPLRCGGLGIRQESESSCDAAFLAAAALTEKAMQNGSESTKPFANESGADMRAMFQSLQAREELQGLEKLASVQELTPETVSNLLPRLQGDVSRHLEEHRHAQLLDTYSKAAEDDELSKRVEGERSVKRMRSVQERSAWAFLEAMPIYDRWVISDAEMKAGLRHLLGLCPAPVPVEADRCRCGQLLAEPDHPMSCPDFAPLRTSRHDLVEDVWYCANRRAGRAVCRQPVNRHLQEAAMAPGERGWGKKGDILAVGMGEMVEIDVTYAVTTTAAQLDKPEGAVVRARESRKTRHHAQGGTAGYTFVPVVMDTFGAMGEEAKREMRKLGKIAASGGRVDAAAFVRNMCTDLSVMHVKGNHLVFQACYGQIARKTGTLYQPGYWVASAEIE